MNVDGSASADEAGVKIVTGDTKVVERGSADKMFITTSGLGLFHLIGIFPPRLFRLAMLRLLMGILVITGQPSLQSRGIWR